MTTRRAKAWTGTTMLAALCLVAFVAGRRGGSGARQAAGEASSESPVPAAAEPAARAPLAAAPLDPGPPGAGAEGTNQARQPMAPVAREGMEAAVDPPAPDPAADPVGVPYTNMVRELAPFFPTLREPPPSPAHETDFRQYTDDMAARLHLSGERSKLEVASLSLFDRMEAPATRLEQQREMVQGFVRAVSDDLDPAPVLAFLAAARAPGPAGAPPPQGWARAHRWETSDKALSVSCDDGYGSCELLATGRGVD